MEKKEKRPLPHRTILLVLAALAGVGLLLLGSSDRFRNSATTPAADATPTEQEEWEIYTASLEKKIAAACEQVRGVRNVTVLLCFEGDFEKVYATDEDTTERDGSTQTTRQYLTVGSGSGEQPVLITRKAPRVSGIGIICEGGDDPAVCRELTDLLCATFGIGANKIYIAEAKPTE